MKTILHFIKESKVSKARWYSSILFVILSSGLSFVLPELLRQGIASVEKRNLQLLFQIGWIALAVTIGTLFIEALVRRTKKIVLNETEQSWQNKILEKIITIKKEALMKYSSGEINTVVNDNIMSASENSLNAIWMLCSGMSILFFAVVYMGYLSWALLFCILAYNVILRLVSKSLEKHISKNANELVAVTKENNTFITSVFNNMLILRTFDFYHFFHSKVEENEKKVKKTSLKGRALHNGLTDGTWGMVKLAEFFIIYGLGGYLVYKDHMPLGNLIAFVFAVDLFVKGLDSFVRYIQNRSDAMAAIGSVNAFFSINQLEDEDLHDMPCKPFAIKLDKLFFSFGETRVLQDVSLEIQPKDKVLLKGPNGQGKSTLLKLLSGLYRPSSGCIYYNDIDASTIHLKGLSQVNTTIPQQSELFDASLEENISLSLSPDHQKVKENLSILNMEQSINTTVSALSQGEKQRLNIGRGIYKEDAFIILGDEIFSNVDKGNAAEIERELAKRWQDMTVVMIAHEKMNLPFNRIFHVEDGKVSEVSNG